jgi:hypothetical protein
MSVSYKISYYSYLKYCGINLEEEEIVDAPGKDGNASMPEKVKRPNPWRKVIMVMIVR